MTKLVRYDQIPVQEIHIFATKMPFLLRGIKFCQVSQNSSSLLFIVNLISYVAHELNVYQRPKSGSCWYFKALYAYIGYEVTSSIDVRE